MSPKLAIEQEHFCILPWIHLHVSQNGRVSPCCNNNIEKSGKESMRQISNRKYAKELYRIEENKPEPIYLDIRFSNICNFKCKTCWHGNSSAWFEEGSKRNASDERIIKAFTTNFDELLTYLDDVQEIYFAGGEPLIMEEHYQILEELEKRELFDVELRYNTNFSNLNFKDKSILEIWKKFKKVHVSASIDAAGKLGEEIREGFNWEQLIENRKQMLAICPNVYFEIAPTVSTLNIFSLPELHQELVKLGLIEINNIYLNFLERPVEYNVKSLSQNEKEKAKTHISNHLDWMDENQVGTAIAEQFKTLLNYLR